MSSGEPGVPKVVTRTLPCGAGHSRRRSQRVSTGATRCCTCSLRGFTSGHLESQIVKVGDVQWGQPRDIITTKDNQRSKGLVQNYIASSDPGKLPKQLFQGGDCKTRVLLLCSSVGRGDGGRHGLAHAPFLQGEGLGKPITLPWLTLPWSLSLSPRSSPLC